MRLYSVTVTATIPILAHDEADAIEVALGAACSIDVECFTATAEPLGQLPSGAEIGEWIEADEADEAEQ